MIRPLTIGILLATGLAGCRTCDNPYDYCGPVVDSGYHGDDTMYEGQIIESGPTELPPPPLPPRSMNGNSAPMNGNQSRLRGTPTPAPRGESVMVQPRKMSR